jgi:anti-sigma regulatory factor (Ser/Thr protein kinase)
MSHELRTPLAAILGYAELIQEGFYGELPEKSMDALTRIRTNGKHLLGLINTVLDIAKIESGQFKLNLAEYALETVVETVRAATESLAETKKLAFRTEIAKSLPIGVGDEQRITQVLLNLIGNALKFTDAGEVRIAADTANGHFTVSVSDTGPDIPAEECERVFEKFRQVDSSNTRAKGGTGLGLAIAREIIEIMGGASGSRRRWVRARRSAWSCPCVPHPWPARNEQAHSRRRAPGGSARHVARFPLCFWTHRDRGRGWRRERCQGGFGTPRSCCDRHSAVRTRRLRCDAADQGAAWLCSDPDHCGQFLRHEG